MFRLSSVILLTLMLFVPACKQAAPSHSLYFLKKDRQKTPSISVEVASSQAERSLGLMYRRELGEHEGMFFIFPDESERSFWMKNTYLSLDIIFLDRELKVVNCAERAVPLTETPRKSTGPAQYVLEVPAGTAARWSLKPGDQAVMEGVPLKNASH